MALGPCERVKPVGADREEIELAEGRARTFGGKLGVKCQRDNQKKGVLWC